jgi:hypothetical protein
MYRRRSARFTPPARRWPITLVIAFNRDRSSMSVQVDRPCAFCRARDFSANSYTVIVHNLLVINILQIAYFLLLYLLLIPLDAAKKSRLVGPNLSGQKTSRAVSFQLGYLMAMIASGRKSSRIGAYGTTDGEAWGQFDRCLVAKLEGYRYELLPIPAKNPPTTQL